MIDQNTEWTVKELVLEVGVDEIALVYFGQKFERLQMTLATVVAVNDGHGTDFGARRLAAIDDDDILLVRVLSGVDRVVDDERRVGQVGMRRVLVLIATTATAAALGPRETIGRVARAANVTEASHVVHVQVVRPRICGDRISNVVARLVDAHPFGYELDLKRAGHSTQLSYVLAIVLVCLFVAEQNDAGSHVRRRQIATAKQRLKQTAYLSV